jgi:hypothetical protein
MSQQTSLGEPRSLKANLSRRQPSGPTLGAKRARRKFLRFFAKGFYDQTYIDWERGYKWEAHQQWNEILTRSRFRTLLQARDFEKIAAHAVRIESRTNLLFSFEKMALRDAVKSKPGAQLFAEGLYDFLFGSASLPSRFNRWCEVVSELPRKQTRVLTWPVVTVFGFIAQPETHMFLKPQVTKIAAREYGFDFSYQSRPAWNTYASLLDFASLVQRNVKDLRPRDMIDIQSFIWVQGSEEYDE